MPPTLKYPTAAVDTGAGGNDAWTSTTNVFAVDGSSAVVNFIGGGDSSNYLKVTGFGFAIPTTAVIDGIQMEYLRSGSNAAVASIKALKASSPIGSEMADFAGDFYPSAGLAWFTYGGGTNLWGATWTPAEINNSGFGVQIAAFNTHGGGSASIDAVRITVYWHIANQDVPKRYLYKIFSATGSYLGNLPNVTSEFGVSLDINTAGSQINITCGKSADTSLLPTDPLTDEAGNPLLDEASAGLTNEGQAPIVAPGTSSVQALIKNGNAIQVWEYSYYWPNGKCMFLGQIERWEADFGGTDDSIKLLAYSDGQDLDNYLVRGNPYTYTGDVTQTSQNSNVLVSTAGMGAGHDWFGETWTAGAGVTNLGAISLLLLGAANVTINVYDNSSLANLLGTTTQFVNVAGATEIQFAFPLPLTTVPGTQYFFEVRVDIGQSITLYYTTTNPYSGGGMYESSFGGSGGGAYGSIAGADMYFKTFSGAGSTTGTFTSLDPSTGMLVAFMNDYIARGGLVKYTSSSIDATGLTLTYTFNTNTTYEGIKAVLSLAPSGFYYYVDLGTSTLYVKRASTTADFTIIKGKHIEKLTFVSTIESVKNQVYFTGGATSGVNLYRQYSNARSVALYGPKLERKTDNRVTVTATADAIGQSDVAEQKDENYSTTVTVLDKTMDITLIKPGMIVGFAGFGTFVDQVLAQVVRVDYSPEEATLQLGILPKRLHAEFDKITRGLIAQQTIANPSVPS